MNDMIMKLDEWGRPAWIALMVVSFVLFWPVGLAVLAFILWSGRMGCGWHGDKSRWQARMSDKWERKTSNWASEARSFGGGFGSSGNRAFDEYREATLKRLEDEQREFRDFLDQLRHAKDRAEFDQFMAERRNRPPAADGDKPEGTPQAP
jgi:hypothetical protein